MRKAESSITFDGCKVATGTMQDPVTEQSNRDWPGYASRSPC